MEMRELPPDSPSREGPVAGADAADSASSTASSIHGGVLVALESPGNKEKEEAPENCWFEIEMEKGLPPPLSAVDNEGLSKSPPGHDAYGEPSTTNPWSLKSWRSRLRRWCYQDVTGVSMVPLSTSFAEEMHGSVAVPQDHQDRGKCRNFWRKMMAFVGPGYLVAVGYMDPGNWATDIAGGALYEYDLLFIVLLSSLLAIFLQSLAVKLGVATRKDLAQMCRDTYSPRVNRFLWLSAEVAISATDMAEVVGSAIALKLLAGIPIIFGVLLTALDVLLVLGAFEKLSSSFRSLEVLVIGIIGVIFVCFAIELSLSQPSLISVMKGFVVPDKSLVTDPGRLFVGIGILGATVMPHNIFLHSSIVQTRALGATTRSRREAMKFATWDTVLALCVALFVNASILIVAGATFYDTTGAIPGVPAPSMTEAYHLLSPLLGTRAAGLLFGVALLASGQNSTLTGTLAGQIVMEGFFQIRLKTWLRRLVTRLTVVIPAVLTVALAGDQGVDTLLIVSQVILSFDLSFAVIPLVAFTSSERVMGPDFVNSTFVKVLAWLAALAIVALNGMLLYQILAHAVHNLQQH